MKIVIVVVAALVVGVAAFVVVVGVGADKKLYTQITTPAPVQAPKAACDAVVALKKLNAKVEMGINLVQYNEALGVMWYDVKEFVDSPESQKFPILKAKLLEAVQPFKDASEYWTLKIRSGSTEKLEGTMRSMWKAGGEKILEVSAMLADAK